MARLTKKREGGGYELCAPEKLSDAILKLAALEDLYDELTLSQQRLSKELEELRIAGKKNSYQFRERMGKKLQNSDAISLLKAHGLDDKASADKKAPELKLHNY